MTKTERLIDRIKNVEKFYDVAFLCEDFQTFVDEIQEWGVDHICGVDFDDPDLNLIMLNAFFGSFGCTPSNPHPCSKYAGILCLMKTNTLNTQKIRSLQGIYLY